MCITEYNEEETMQLFKEEGREEGLAKGREEGLVEARSTMIRTMLSRGLNREEIARFTDIPIESIQKIEEEAAVTG